MKELKNLKKDIVSLRTFLTNSILKPQFLHKFFAQSIIRSLNFNSYERKLNYEIMPYPNYAYGTYHAAIQAKALGIENISVIEFGVAGGNGLVALENIAQDIEEAVGIKISVYGFDTGEGLPEILDHRDLPYVYQKGFFPMDVKLLKARLKKAKLILGDVKDTIKTFPIEESPAPIGFISFDLDYYSSTAEAFQLFDEPNNLFLPRVFCYFDDCIGGDYELHSEFTGELLIINEFNQKKDHRKLAKIHGLRHKRIFESRWNDVMFVLHSFDHHLYCQNISPQEEMQYPYRLIDTPLAFRNKILAKIND